MPMTARRTDESLNPSEEEEDVAEEFDSNASASSSSNESDSDQDEKMQKQLKKAKTAKEGKSHKKPVEVKKGKDPKTPKRPMLWLKASQEKIKSDHPGISITDLSKKGRRDLEGNVQRQERGVGSQGCGCQEVI
ncbi:FACT complex subunit SSRP1 [Tupaia chinensis]|uniref:FACT complex subunit SSRP1 n=1 Tax=Tupaia chinensis TaxID=246437 RepID=L9L2B8_TUPCH|nr:FACT complex subunit SSRP1 [Tupaia chinensis]